MRSLRAVQFEETDMRRTVLCIAAILCGCGGGSSTGPTPTLTMTSVPQGLYSGTTSAGGTMAGGTMAGLVLPDGSFYFLYTAPGNTNLIGGAIQGSMSALDGTFLSVAAKDVDLLGWGVLTTAIQGTYTIKQRLAGTVNFLSMNQSVGFDSVYSSQYEVPASLAAIAGTYVGNAGTPAGSESTTISVSAAGAVAGVGASGCTFSGVASPIPNANAFQISMTMGGAPCAEPNTVLTGAAFYEASTRRLFGVGMTASRDNGAVFAGTKQCSTTCAR
jgi:hypothetical protein